MIVYVCMNKKKLCNDICLAIGIMYVYRTGDKLYLSQQRVIDGLIGWLIDWLMNEWAVEWLSEWASVSESMIQPVRVRNEGF